MVKVSHLKIILLLLGFAALLQCGCFNNKLSEYKNIEEELTQIVSSIGKYEGVETIGVLPLQGDSDYFFTDSLVKAIVESKKYRVLERQYIEESIVKEIGFGLTDVVDPQTASRAGKVIGSDAVIFGKVTNEDKAVTIRFRLINSETAEILWVWGPKSIPIEQGFPIWTFVIGVIIAAVLIIQGIKLIIQRITQTGIVIKEPGKIFKEPGEIFMEEPVKISDSERNRHKISSAFLSKNQGTIMLWAYVDPVERGGIKKDARFNRYLVAHATNEGLKRNNKYLNESGESKKIDYPDDNSFTGWHHFGVSWDIANGIIRFIVDGKFIPASEDDIKYWPEKFDRYVTIGTWASGWEFHYCNTRVARVKTLNHVITPEEIEKELMQKSQLEG